jgi:OmpA-OmpF porin, OOP family
MKRTTTLIAGLATAALLAAAPVAQAQQAETGFYVGGSFGQTEFKDFCSDARSGGYVGGSCDEKDSGWKAFFGYRINRHFAIEGSYVNWGEASLNGGTFLGVPANATGELTSWGVAAVGIIPIGERFWGFGKIGFMRSEVDVNVNVAGFAGAGSESDTEAHYGLGLGFNITPRLAVRGEWERAADNKANMLSIGLQYRF